MGTDMRPRRPRLGVAAVVESSDSRLLMCRTEPRGWALPGGFVDHGEAPIQALKREVGEETGYNVQPSEFIGAYLSDDPHDILTLLFRCRLTNIHPVIPRDTECEEVAWQPLEEAQKLTTHEPSRLRLAHALTRSTGHYAAYRLRNVGLDLLEHTGTSSG